MHNGGMFLRGTLRVKDGKEHRYWSIVENRRGSSRRIVQRQVLYLGEINDSGVRWHFSRRIGRPRNWRTKWCMSV